MYYKNIVLFKLPVFPYLLQNNLLNVNPMSH